MLYYRSEGAGCQNKAVISIGRSTACILENYRTVRLWKRLELGFRLNDEWSTYGKKLVRIHTATEVVGNAKNNLGDSEASFGHFSASTYWFRDLHREEKDLASP